MPEPEVLRVYDNWENGIGHLRDDGSPSLYTSNKILGLKGELRPAPAATQIPINADPGHHFQYFFEEPSTAQQTPTFDASSSVADALTVVQTWSHTVGSYDERLLVVFAISLSVLTLPPVTVRYANRELTAGPKITSGNTHMFLYYLVSPDIGTNDILIQWDVGAPDIGIGLASSWYKIDQTGPFSESISDIGLNDAGPATVAVVSGTPEIVIDATLVTSSVTTMAIGANQTEMLESGDGTNCTTALKGGGSYGTLTDTDESWTVDEWIGSIVTCNSETMTITTNTATELRGTGDWSGDPGDGHAWAIGGGRALGDLRAGSSYETGASPTTMSWTLGAACDWIILATSLVGANQPGPNYLYAQRGRKSVSRSPIKVNKISLANMDFAIASTTSYHNLTPLTTCGQPVRYQGYWWFPMGDNQKARRLQTIGISPKDSAANINEGGTFSATDTTLTVDDGTKFTVQDYIKIENELLWVTFIDGNDLTVIRGQHNTTAATHADGTDIYLISVGNDTLDATGTALGADHFANLNNQIISTLKHSTNDAGGIRVLAVDGDIGTEANWGSAFQVGDKNERSAGIASLTGLSFVLTIEGLFSFTDTGRSGMIFEDFRTWRHVFDNISIKPWRQGLLLSHPTGLLYYTPGQPPINVGIDITPAEAAIPPPGPPALRGGRYHSIAPIGDFIPAIYQPDLNSTTVNVLIGYPATNEPAKLVWQHLATTELQDTDHMLGCYVAVGSKPISAEYVTPTLWYGNGDDLDYIVLNSRASPFRTREDTHVITTSGDAYFPEIFFPTPYKLSHIIVYTQDMISGDEWQISAIINAGDYTKAGAPIKTSQRAKRPLTRGGVYRLMLHINWKATSTASRVPPTIKKIEIWGTEE